MQECFPLKVNMHMLTGQFTVSKMQSNKKKQAALIFI